MKLRIYILALLFAGCQSDKPFYLPAEWDPHKAMMVSFNDDDPAADSVSVEIVKAISPLMKVYCVIMSDTLIPHYSAWFEREHIPKDSIQFMNFGSSFSYSIRDPLFFLKNKDGETMIADFEFNDYGYLPDDLAKRSDFLESSRKDREGYQTNFTALFPFPLISSKMVNEGGAIEVNGKGTILQVESVNKQRNPGMTLEEQDAELKKILGITHVIWLKEGVADDPDGKVLITGNYFGIGVNGHIDEFCRFVNDSTLFLAFPDSIEAEKNPVVKLTYDRMKTNLAILDKAVDQEGKHFTIIKTPVPDLNPVTYVLDSLAADPETKRFSRLALRKYNQFHTGDTALFLPASSYLNFLVTNKAVLIPKYWQPGLPETTKQKDEEIKRLFESYFPGRKIIQINPLGLNFNGGGIHCWTQQVPE